MAHDHPLSPNGLTHVVLDANVLLPPRLSDILFDLCLAGLYNARWTADIEAEFLRNWPRLVAKLAIDGVQLTAEQMASTAVNAKRRLMHYQSAVPDYLLVGYEDRSVLDRVAHAVDTGDKHVAAAALVLHDNVRQFDVNDRVFIVSSNLKHIAPRDMKQLGIRVLTPGKFIDSLTKADSNRVSQALSTSISSLKNPPYTRAQILGVLQLHGAIETARHFASIWGEHIPPIRPRR